MTQFVSNFDLQQAYQGAFPDLVLCGLLSVIALLSFGVFAMRRNWLDPLFLGMHAAAALIHFLAKFPLWTLWINDAIIAQSVELVGFIGLVTFLVGFVDRLFIKDRQWLLCSLWRLSVALAFVLLALLLSGYISVDIAFVSWQIWSLLALVGVVAAIVRLSWQGLREAKILGNGVLGAALTVMLDIGSSMGWLSTGLQGRFLFVFFGYSGLLAVCMYIIFRRARLVYDDLAVRGRELETLSFHGRRIASASRFPDLVRRVEEAVLQISGSRYELVLYFSASVFVGRLLEQAFYLIDEHGDPQENSFFAASGLYRSGCETLFVRDPRTGENLAAVRVESGGTNSVRLLLTNLASAIANVRFRTAFRILEIRTQEQRVILSNLDQGILLLDSEGRVLPGASEHCKVILGTDDPVGKDFFEDLLQFVYTNVVERHSLRERIRYFFRKSVPEFMKRQAQLPSELCFVSAGNRRIVEIEWVPVIGTQSVVERVMVVMRDVTHLRLLRVAAMRKETESALTGELLGVDSEMSEMVMRRCSWLLRLLKSLTEGKNVCSIGDTSLPATLDAVIADASHAGLHRLTAALQKVQQVGCTSRSVNSSVALLSEEVESADSLLAEYMALAHRFQIFLEESGMQRFLGVAAQVVDEAAYGQDLSWHRFYREFVGLFEPTLRRLVNQLVVGLRSTALEADREPPLMIVAGEDDWVFSRTRVDFIQSILIHLARNSLVHGFRSGFSGTIYLLPKREGDFWLLDYWDDGVGLDLTALREIGLSRGAFSTSNPSDEEIAHIIFADGSSTVDQHGNLAGRGFGMSAVRHMLQGIGGEIHLSLADDGAGSERRRFVLSMVFPADVVYVGI